VKYRTKRRLRRSRRAAARVLYLGLVVLLQYAITAIMRTAATTALLFTGSVLATLLSVQMLLQIADHMDKSWKNERRVSGRNIVMLLIDMLLVIYAPLVIIALVSNRLGSVPIWRSLLAAALDVGIYCLLSPVVKALYQRIGQWLLRTRRHMV